MPISWRPDSRHVLFSEVERHKVLAVILVQNKLKILPFEITCEILKFTIKPCKMLEAKDMCDKLENLTSVRSFLFDDVETKILFNMRRLAQIINSYPRSDSTYKQLRAAFLYYQGLVIAYSYCGRKESFTFKFEDGSSFSAFGF